MVQLILPHLVFGYISQIPFIYGRCTQHFEDFNLENVKSEGVTQQQTWTTFAKLYKKITQCSQNLFVEIFNQ